MTTKDRICKLCKEKGISIRKAERDLGFACGYIAKLDKNAPSSDKINAIAEYLGVTIDYLINGNEESFTPEIAHYAADIRKDTKLQMLLHYWGSIDDEDKESVMKIIESLSRK